MKVGLFSAIAFVILTYSGSALADTGLCGTEEEPCQVGELTYRVVLPDTPENAPAVIYLHGYAASANSAVKMERLTTAFTAQGIAVIAPNGQVDLGNPKNANFANDAMFHETNISTSTMAQKNHL